jgi:hypothetical protein
MTGTQTDRIRTQMDRDTERQEQDTDGQGHRQTGKKIRALKALSFK